MEKKNIEWSKLGFGYMPVDYRFVAHWKDGSWDEGGLTENASVTISESAGVLQYAQTCFEGLKVYTQKNGMDADCIHPYHCFYFNACSRSAMMSSIFSIPTLKRIRSG